MRNFDTIDIKEEIVSPTLVDRKAWHKTTILVDPVSCSKPSSLWPCLFTTVICFSIVAGDLISIFSMILKFDYLGFRDGAASKLKGCFSEH